jgi:hypothetical protein
MAYVLPFRPWLSPALRVLRIRTTWSLSTDPALVLSCTSAPPQRLAPTIVACREKLGRPCLPRETPRVSSRPFSMSKWKRPSSSPGFWPGVREALLVFPKVPPSGFGYPLGGVSAFHPRKPLSAPHALGLCPSGLFSHSVAHNRFPGCVPLLRFPARLSGLATALQRFSLTKRAVRSAPRLSFKSEWRLCPPELLHLPGFLPPDL